MDQKEMDEFGYLVCKSCGVTVGRHRLYGHSHNLPKGQFKSLETDPANIAIRCQNWMGIDGCHELFDDCNFNGIRYFLDLDQIMQYRKDHDRNAYNKFVTGLKSVGNEDYDYLP
jgi:hypothetical protein